MPEAKPTTKGQITLPKSVREALGLSSGDRVAFVEDADGYRLMPANRDVRELRGMLFRKGRKALTVEEMDAAIGKRVGRG